MLKYITLGIVQGVTEFLPVSSSGHLLIAQRFLGLNADEIGVSIVLHLGTVLALVLFFFNRILRLLCNRRLVLLVVIVSIITAVIGFLGKDYFERMFTSYKFLALGWVFTGIILILANKFINSRRNILGVKDACILGVAQAVAIIPSVSRSGMTVAALLFRKIEKKTAFEFSFIAGIPAIAGAAALEAKRVGFAMRQDSASLIAGFICSFLSGYLSLFIFEKAVNRAKLHYFGYYCLVAALVTFMFLK